MGKSMAIAPRSARARQRRPGLQMPPEADPSMRRYLHPVK